MNNLLAEISSNSLSPFRWENQPAHWEPLTDGGLRIHVPPRVDYFQDPTGVLSADSAPFMWLPVQGDFTVRAYVRHPFASTYDAGALMVRQDATHWAKLCFEATDFGSRAVVSVVTNGTSDDANGVDVSVSDIWLQIARRGNLFAMHYALDGRCWRMVRYFALDLANTRVGLVAQCPVGQGAVIDWLSFSIDERTSADMRAGI